jgi:hypothetical protein
MQSDDKGIVNYSASDSSENEYRAESPSEQVQLPVHSPVKWRSISVLSLEDAGKELQAEVRSLRNYYEKDLNPTRNGPPLCKSSMDKL